MRVKPRYITKKEYLVHPASVRAYLKKKGYDIASWHANGRISGLSNIHGQVEVKENYEQKSYEIVNKYRHVSTHIVWVEITIWNEDNYRGKVDREKLLNDLISGGFNAVYNGEKYIIKSKGVK